MKKVFASLALLALVGAGCNTQSSSNNGPDGKKLTLTTPKTVAIAQDDKASVEITIERKKFEDPVTIQLKMPEGVTVTENDAKLDKGVNKRTFILMASEKAKVGPHKMTVVAFSGDMKDTNELTIDVKEKSTSSTSGSSPVSGDDANLKKKREELGNAIQKEMKDIDASMATLRKRAETAEGKTKDNLNNRIEELNKEQQNLRKEYDQVQTTTAANWNDFSARVTAAANRLAEGTRKALDEFKK